jgi:hypothetical protein
MGRSSTGACLGIHPAESRRGRARAQSGPKDPRTQGDDATSRGQGARGGRRGRREVVEGKVAAAGWRGVIGRATAELLRGSEAGGGQWHLGTGLSGIGFRAPAAGVFGAGVLGAGVPGAEAPAARCREWLRGTHGGMTESESREESSVAPAVVVSNPGRMADRGAWKRTTSPSPSP